MQNININVNVNLNAYFYAPKIYKSNNFYVHVILTQFCISHIYVCSRSRPMVLGIFFKKSVATRSILQHDAC